MAGDAYTGKLASWTPEGTPWPTGPLRTLRFLAPGLRQLSGDSPIKRGVRALVLLVERESCQLERVEDIAEVELRYSGDALGIVIHARARVELA